jgi:sterol desaturase/sphingolipid hydroxylase (fatty acid hydroxylase superfamily)
MHQAARPRVDCAHVVKDAIYYAAAVPFFFLLIGLELWVARKRKLTVYRFSDAIADLSAGITQQVMLVLLGGVYLFVYAAAHDRLRLVSWPSGSAWPWVVALVGVDFGYYWWHRLSHHVNILWAGHVVHHTSEDYNYAVALRQAIFTTATYLPFIGVPMALLGISPEIYGVVVAFNTLYQFWIHTELVGTLGPLEAVLNTPSHHRVHHAINPRYIDKNFGGTLIIWDKLFGTFAPETEPCVYGTVKPLRSFNPLWVQVHYFAEMFALARAAPRWMDKLLVLVKGPAWRPRGLPQAGPVPEVSRETYVKYDPPSPRPVRWYVFGQFAAVVAATPVLMVLQYSAPLVLLAPAVALVLLSLLSFGALLEGKGWGHPLETARLLIITAAALAMGLARGWMPGALVVAAVGAAAVVSWLWLRRAMALASLPDPVRA